MVAQELQPDLAAALQRARKLEALAAGLDQQRRAIAGTAALMLAAVDAGWPIASVARTAGLHPRTARARVQSARARYHEHRPAIVLDEPLRARRPLDVLKQPVTDREWLSLPEASAHTGRSLETIRQWRRRGLLPHTQVIARTRMLYLRADLDRVLAGPSYRRGSVNQAALLGEIRRSSVR